MTRIFLTLSILVVLNFIVDAQSKERIKFSSINQFGILKGKSDQTWQLQTVNGIKYKAWSAGVGIGLENYYFKTIPLFVDVRRNLFSNRKTPFIYADVGMNFPSKKEVKGDWQSSKYSKGLYYDLGLGYNIPLKGSLSFNFSAGLSCKKIKEERIYTIIWDFPPYGDNNSKEYFDFSFRRISIKAALQF